MPLEGKQLTVEEALALAYWAGFHWRNLTVAVAVMTAESDRYTKAYHLNDNGSTDRGLFQINSIHDGKISPDEAFVPSNNTEFAMTLSTGGGEHPIDFTPWSAYNSGRYKEYMGTVRKVRFLRRWRRLIRQMPERADA